MYKAPQKVITHGDKTEISNVVTTLIQNIGCIKQMIHSENKSLRILYRNVTPSHLDNYIQSYKRLKKRGEKHGGTICSQNSFKRNMCF